MNYNKKRLIGTCIAGVMTVATAAGTVQSVEDIKVVEASVNKDIHDVHAKVEHITYSLTKNYLGLKNIGQWQKYIKEARALNAKLPNGSSKDKYESRIDRAEALVNAAARVNQVEKSMDVNTHTMKNIPQWDQYIDLAKTDLAKVDLGVFKARYNELLERAAERSKAIDVVKVKYNDSYKKVEALVKEAEELAKTDSAKALEKYKEAKIAAQKLQTHISKNELLDKVDKLINNTPVQPVQPVQPVPPSGGGGGSVVQPSEAIKQAERLAGQIGSGAVIDPINKDTINIIGNTNISNNITISKDVKIIVKDKMALNIESGKSITNNGTIIVGSGATVNNSGEIINKSQMNLSRMNRAVTPKSIVVEAGGKLNVESGSKLIFDKKDDIITNSNDSISLYEGTEVVVGGKTYIGGDNALVKLKKTSAKEVNKPVAGWFLNTDGLLVLIVFEEATVDKDGFDLNIIAKAEMGKTPAVVKIDAFKNMSDGSSIHMEAGSKLYLGSTEYIGSNTGADFQIKCTPALIGEVGNQFYHNGAGVTLRQMDNVTSLCFSGQVSTNETFDASEIAKTTNVQYIPYNDYYKCDLSGVWTKSDKSKVVSPNEIAKYITWDNNAITRVQIGSSNNNPYQLMQINYNRLQEVNSSKLTITGVGNVDGKFNKQFHTTPGSKIQSNDAMFQWSYRDLSTLESDGSNLDELERTNDTLLPVGTKIRIDIEVEKNGVPYTISNEYTITDEDVKNATYDQTPPKIIDYSTNSSSFVDNKFTEGDTITLYTNEKLDTNSVPIQSSLDTTIGTGIVTATIEGNRVEIVINKGKEIAAKNSITLRAGSIKDISNNSMGEYILELRDEYKNASSDIRTIFSSRKESKFNCDFNWFSVNGIGSNEVETPYYSDGTYLRFKVETEEENTYKQKTFNDVFEDMTLQTENGAVDSIKGLEPGRQYEDWNGVQTKDYTKFQPEGGKYVFYGVSQSTEGVTKTLGFEKGKERIVKGVFTLKTGINCNVRIIAEVMQQGNDTILSSEKINIYKN